MNRIILFVVLCCVFSVSNSEDLHLIGVGEYKELSSTYYYGALYSDSLKGGAKSFLDSASNNKLVMRVIKDKISPRRFYRLWSQTLAINNTENDLNKYEDDILSFTYMLKGNLKKGDEITIEMESGKTVSSINGHNVKTYKKPDFINVLLRGWIGRYPPTSSFKKGLLGLDKTNQQQYLLTYRSLFPAKDRYDEIKKWNEKVVYESVEKIVEANITNKDILQPTPVSLQKIELVPVVSNKKTQSEKVTKIVNRLPPSAETKKYNAAIARLKALQKSKMTYYRNLISHASKYADYPKRALRLNQAGYVKVSVEIDKTGKVLNAFVLDESKYSLLNSAAVKSTFKASPFPGMPKLISAKKFEFTVPFTFKPN